MSLQPKRFGKVSVLNDDLIVLELLVKAAKEVVPLMERRDWYVDHLMEFSPTDKNLYGLNIKTEGSITIKIRCRHHTTRKIFSYTNIMKTLLHELAHIRCGAHDEAFYTLLNQLTVENTGHVLDSSFRDADYCSISRNELRERMARAAEKRTTSILNSSKISLPQINIRTLISGGGIRLGSIHEVTEVPRSNEAVREAARMAAILRASLSDK